MIRTKYARCAGTNFLWLCLLASFPKASFSEGTNLQTVAPEKTMPVIVKQASITKGKITMTVRIPERNEVSHPIPLEISVRNDSGKNISYGWITEYSEWELAVKTPYGDNIPLTRYGNFHFGGERGFKTFYTPRILKSGDTLQVKLNVARFYDLTFKGDYILTVKRPLNEVSETEKQLVLECEPVAFKVTETK